MLSPKKFRKLDEKLLSGQRRYQKCLSVAYLIGYSSVAEAVLDSYYNKKENGVKIALKLGTTHPVWVYDFLTSSGFILRPKGFFLDPILPEDSFKQIDKKIMFHFEEEKLSIAKEMGYNYISEAMTDLYYNQNKDRGFIAKKFNTSGTSIHYSLRRINMVTKKNKTRLNFEKLNIDDRLDVSTQITDNSSWINIRNTLYKLNIDPSQLTIRKLLRRKQ